MNKNKAYKKSTPAGNRICGIGPAGIHCSCCIPVACGKTGSLKQVKVFLNRYWRRTGRMAVKKSQTDNQ